MKSSLKLADSSMRLSCKETIICHEVKLQTIIQLKYNIHSERATRGVLLEKVFLEISQNSQENTCARVSFLIKLQARLRTPFFQNTSGRLLLSIKLHYKSLGLIKITSPPNLVSNKNSCHTLNFSIAYG